MRGDLLIGGFEMETPSWLPHAVLATGIGVGLKMGGDALAKRPAASSHTITRNTVTPQQIREDLKERHDMRVAMIQAIYSGKELTDQLKLENETYLNSLR